MRKIGNLKYLWIHLARDLGCAVSFKERESNVKIKLKNGNIVSFNHHGKTGCSDFSIVSRLTYNAISRLKKSPIKTIRFMGTDHFHDVKNIKWGSFFIDKFR